MTSAVYLVSSPLQYLLARLIDAEYPADQVLYVQYVEFGDFASTFDKIDYLLGNKVANRMKFKIGAPLPVIACDRLFLSNRFNPVEIYLQFKMRARANRLCAFEDGVALYLHHFYKDARLNDHNLVLSLKNGIKRAIHACDDRFWNKIPPRSFPVASFDEFYSIYSEIPGMRTGAIWHSLQPALVKLKQLGRGDLDERALVLSQSLVVDGFVNHGEYYQYLQNRLLELKRRHSRVFLKAHPRDVKDAIAALCEVTGCELLSEPFASVPVELFLAMHPGTSVYGFWSSSLMYAAGALSLPAFSFVDDFEHNHAVSQQFRDAWKGMATLLGSKGVKQYLPGN